MGYSESIKELLTPIGVYDLDIGAGAAEIEALGDELDEAESVSETLFSETNVLTANDFGLRSYEELFPFAVMNNSVASRRMALGGLMQMDGKAFSLCDINKTVQGCGIETEIQETQTNNRVSVSFPNYHGIPENINAIKERIERILPSHVEAVYSYTYPTWERIEEIGTWEDIGEYTWRSLEHLS